MASHEATVDEMRDASEGDEKTSPSEEHKDSMMPRYIYDTTSSVQERLMQRADAAASTSDGETDQGTHPNNTEAKVNGHSGSNEK